MVNIEQLTELYFASDEPVPYKLKCGVEVNIRPIKVKNWSAFNKSLGVLTIEKNEINDIDIIRMSYLEFLINLMSQNKDYINCLINIFKYSIGEELLDTHIINGKTNLAILDSNIVNFDADGKEYNPIKFVINSKEFDDIKKIILFQNIYDYDDRYISPDVKDLYAQYIQAISSNNQEDPTLERKKVFVMGKTGCSIKELNDMSYRMFSQIYTIKVEIDLYYAKKMIQASQKYDVKEEIIYPLFEKKKDKYDGLFLSRDSVESKLGKIQ